MVPSGSLTKSNRHATMSAWAVRAGEQKTPASVSMVVFVVLFGLARLMPCMGEAFMVMHSIVAVASRRLRERILIFPVAEVFDTETAG